MSAKEAKKTEASDTNYRVKFKPPEGHPETFTATRSETDPDTGEDTQVEYERPYLMDMTVPAKSKDAARLYAEKHALNLAIQEAGTEDPDEVLKKQWQVESVEPVTEATE